MLKDNTIKCIVPERPDIRETAKRHLGYIIEDYKNNDGENLTITSWEAKAIYLMNKLDSTKHIIRSGLSRAGLTIITSCEWEVVIGKA